VRASLRARRARAAPGGYVASVRAAFIRDAAMTAVVFGFFASSWFGWAQEAPPATWRRWLGAATVLSLITAAGGGIVAWRHWSSGTAFDDVTGRAFGVVVGIEFGAAAVGAVMLALNRRAEWIPVWVAFVVGAHLFPVAAIMDYPAVHVAGALVTVAAVTAVPWSRARSLQPSAAVGPLAGTALLAVALYSLATTL
jgi:hypothetical protein